MKKKIILIFFGVFYNFLFSSVTEKKQNPLNNYYQNRSVAFEPINHYLFKHQDAHKPFEYNPNLYPRKWSNKSSEKNAPIYLSKIYLSKRAKEDFLHQSSIDDLTKSILFFSCGYLLKKKQITLMNKYKPETFFHFTGTSFSISSLYNSYLYFKNKKKKKLLLEYIQEELSKKEQDIIQEFITEEFYKNYLRSTEFYNFKNHHELITLLLPNCYSSNLFIKCLLIECGENFESKFIKKDCSENIGQGGDLVVYLAGIKKIKI